MERRTTGMEKGMEESDIEVLATHGGPGHALFACEGAAKRWFGVRVGGLLSPEIGVVRGADAVIDVEGDAVGGVFASCQRAPRGLWNLCMRVISSC